MARKADIPGIRMPAPEASGVGGDRPTPAEYRGPQARRFDQSPIANI
jgi:hypothetical protein